MASAMIYRSGVLRTSAAYRPSPTLFVYPGLASRPWWDAADFEWAGMLAHVHKEIRDEFLALVQGSDAPASDYDPGEHKLHSGQWDWFSYVAKGKRRDAFARRCPTTASVLDAIPGLLADTPMDFAFFSRLADGASISPHHAPHNMRVRCHLPLIVPDGDCGIRVGGETRRWEVGKPMLFDDSFEHETWNRAGSDRVVLLFDVWHPDLSEGERRAVVEMFEGAARREGHQ